jgi:hypothetical protein
VPPSVLHTLTRQLGIEALGDMLAYSAGEQRWEHAAEIRARYGYVEITERQVGFRLGRWLYALCWTGTDRPSVLFERATTWLVPAGSRNSPLDRLRTGPVRVSSPSLVMALRRLYSVRELGIKVPAVARIPATRVAALARFAGAAKVSAILRLPDPRRLATLVAFVHCLEATAQDDALEVLEALLRDLFSDAVKADKKARLRTLRDLDQAAGTLASACQMLLDTSLSDDRLRSAMFEKIPHDNPTRALDGVNALIRSSDNVYYQELDAKYRTVRRFLPELVEHIHFSANAAGAPIVAAFDWLRASMARKEPGDDAPREVVGKPWQRHVLHQDGTVDFHPATCCFSAICQAQFRAQSQWRVPPQLGLLPTSTVGPRAGSARWISGSIPIRPGVRYVFKAAVYVLRFASPISIRPLRLGGKLKLLSGFRSPL